MRLQRLCAPVNSSIPDNSQDGMKVRLLGVAFVEMRFFRTAYKYDIPPSFGEICQLLLGRTFLVFVCVRNVEGRFLRDGNRA